MSRSPRDTTLALAGVFQAAALVEQLAKTGYVPSTFLEASVSSLFKQNPDSVLDVYGDDIAHVELGLQVMNDLLQHRQSREHPDSLRYVLGMLHLQKKLLTRRDMLEVIGKRINQSAEQSKHFGVTHENVLAGLADIYSDTISTFRFRIQVSGDFAYLQQARIANMVRTLLMAGIRSATLWRQVGGNRFQVIFARKKTAQLADDLLREIKSRPL